MVTLFFGGWDIPFTAWDNTPPWTVLKFARHARRVLGEGGAVPAHLHVGALDAPAVPLRPADGLGWKVLLPVALAYVMVVAVLVLGPRVRRRPVRHPLRAVAHRGEPGARSPCCCGASTATGSSAGRRRASGRGGAPTRRARRGRGLMAITVKALARPESESSYVRATLKGMALTFKHLFATEVDDAVPGADEHGGWTLSKRWRGTHRMAWTRPARRSAWPAACARRCARRTASSSCRARTRRATAIRWSTRSTSSAACSAATARRSARRRRSTSACHYENAEYSRDGFVYDLERLMAQTHPVSTLWDPGRPEGGVMP